VEHPQERSYVRISRMERGRDQGTGFTGRSIFKDYLCGGSNTTIKLRLNTYRGMSQTKHDLGHIIHGERQKQGKINEREDKRKRKKHYIDYYSNGKTYLQQIMTKDKSFSRPATSVESVMRDVPIETYS
jgi:hypothetical protein